MAAIALSASVCNKKYRRGFTLIEMMVVIVIVAILTAIAYPSYLSQIRRSNRADAKVALTDIAQRLERCYTTFGSFTSASCATASALAGGIASTNGFYSVTVSNFTDSTYTLKATAIKTPQISDTGCTAFTLDHLSVRAPSACW